MSTRSSAERRSRLRPFLGLLMAAVVMGSASGPVASATRGDMKSHRTEIATLAGGCFWCMEAVFDQLQGVERVVSGYAGGTVPNPTYEQVSSGTTGHAETVQITFDPAVLSYRDLRSADDLVLMSGSCGRSPEPPGRR